MTEESSTLIPFPINSKDPCSTCKEEVLDTQRALFCDLCEWWEHLNFMKACERPSEQCYKALIESRCNSIVFTCSCCRRKGTLARKLFQSEVALESAHSELKFCERLLHENQQHLKCSCAKRDVLLMESKGLCSHLEDAHDICSKVDVFQLENKWLSEQLSEAHAEAEKLRLDLLKDREWSFIIPASASIGGSVLSTSSIANPVLSSASGQFSQPVRCKLPSTPQLLTPSEQASAPAVVGSAPSLVRSNSSIPTGPLPLASGSAVTGSQL